MTEQPKFHELHRIAQFAAALSVATDRINVLSAKLAILADTSGVAALRIADLSSNTARMVAQSQAMTTACQCKCGVTPQSDQPSSLLAKALSVMFVGAALVAAAKLWRDAIGGLLKTNIGRAGLSRAIAGVGVAGRVLEAVIGTEFAASIAAGVSGVVAGLAIPEVALTIAALVTGAAVGVGASYLLWRNWSAIVRTIRNAGSALSDEAAAIIRNVASIVAGQSEPYSNEQSDPDTEGRATRNRTRHRNSLASSGWNSLVASAFRFPPAVFMTLEEPQTGNGSRALTTPLRRTASALLAVPFLVTPALASVPVERPQLDSRNAVSVTLNSSPTIVINSNDTEQIEQRVLEALRHHREALFEQWHSELRRRQRTEL